MFFGNVDWDIGWIGFYDFILNELFEKQIPKYEDFIKYLESLKQIHTFIPYKDIVFISDRPVEINLNKDGKLHSNTRPSLRYEDNYALFHINGKEIKGEALNDFKHNMKFSQKLEELLK